MSATKTQAFILKTQDYRDTSLLGHFYTRDYGKIHGIVKGIRDTRARFGSTLEPFSLNEILFYRRRRGGDLHQVTQVELLNLFAGVRSDLERLAHASYFTELLNQLVEMEDPAPLVFELLNDSLLFLESGASPKRSARIFETKLLGLLGHAPQIRECILCRTPSPDPCYFSVELGGIHCKNCSNTSARHQSVGGSSSFLVSKGALNFLEHVRRLSVSELLPIKVSQSVGEEVEKILRRFLDFHLQSKLKTLAFLEKMGY